MRILVLGAGNIGLAIIHDLLFMEPKVSEVHVVDANNKRLKEIRKIFRDRNIKTITADVTKRSELLKLLNDVDVVCSSLPGRISHRVIKEILTQGISVVDTSYSPEDPFELSNLARDAKATYIPDSGFCPGISNLLIGYAASKLESIKNVQIIVGGLPQNPKPPLYYTLTWSIEDLIEEYTRVARVIRDNEIKLIDPLSKIMRINLEGLGTFEAIYTDGLRTLLKTIKAENMSEITIRYPGHLSKIKTLRDLGFLDDREIIVMGQRIKPRSIAIALLRDLMRSDDPRDIAILRIIIDGYLKGNVSRYQFDLVDKYDEVTGLTAMSRTTGFTCAIIARLVAKKKIDPGVVPLELIGKKENLYESIIREFQKRNVVIKVTAPRD